MQQKMEAFHSEKKCPTNMRHSQEMQIEIQNKMLFIPTTFTSISELPRVSENM